MFNSHRSLTGLLAAGSILLAPALAAAHPITADGNPADWSFRFPSVANVGLIARNAMGHGEYIWRDAIGDTRTDIATPEVTADITQFQVTGSPTGIGFLLRRAPGTAFPGAPIQVQIAIDTDRVAGNGQDFFAGFADTKVANGARWERLVQTLFGSGGKAQVIDTAFNKVADAEAAVGAGGDVEIFVPWAALGLNAPPATPLRFTVATFRAQNNDITVDIGGAAISNAVDCISDYGDPAAAMYPNTWNDVMDGVVDYNFDLWFDAQGEVVAPLVVQRFLPNSSGGGADEWYAVRNTTGATLSLDKYKIGDETTPDGNEGMFVFPAGATIGAGATYVIARSGSAYQAFFGKAPDAELPPGATVAVPDLTPFTAWTSAATPNLQLANAGDELLILDPSNTILDIAVFGNGAYTGVASFTGAVSTDEVITRNAQSGDTDDGQVDFSNGGKACTADAQCGGACNQCSGNVCGPKPLGASCADANPCDGDEVCDGKGACGAAIAPPCDDNNPCTADACTPANGCSHTPLAAGTSCSDNDVCNGAEICSAAGVCAPGTSLDCVDADPCTVDTCDKVMGCQHATAADGASCDDGDACNGMETCVSGMCTTGTMPDCDDANPCTADACDMANGCTHTNVSDGISCSDGDVCNGDEVCVAGTCSAGTALSCDDGNGCTVDACDMTNGCSHTNASDGTSCSGEGCNGTCTSGACQCGAGGAGTGGSGTGGSTSSSSSSGSATSSSSSSGSEGGAGTGGNGGGITDSACGCKVAGGDDGDGANATWLLAIAAAAVGRRRRASKRQIQSNSQIAGPRAFLCYERAARASSPVRATKNARHDAAHRRSFTSADVRARPRFWETFDMITKKTFAWVSTVVGMVAVVACGGGDGGEGGNGGNGGAGAGTNTGTNTSTSVTSKYTCCINDAHYRCPDKASFDKCAGFDIDACMLACTPGDFNCMDSCFMQWDTATNDPSGCTEDATVQCGGTGGTGGGGPVGSCVGDWDGANCDYDADCASNNCFENKCYATDNGNPCDYDADCNSNNCYNNCCYANSAGNPCDYDADCTSNNCYNNKCQ